MQEGPSGKTTAIVLVVAVVLAVAAIIILVPFGKSTPEPAPPETATSADLNQDGRTSAVDLTLIKKYLGKTPGSEGVPEEADVNRDGKIDQEDVKLVRQMILRAPRPKTKELMTSEPLRKPGTAKVPETIGKEKGPEDQGTRRRPVVPQR